MKETNIERILSQAKGLAKSEEEGFDFAGLVERASKITGVSQQQIFSRSRRADVALLRQILMHLAREQAGWTLNKTAKFFNRENHGTVMHAEKTIRRALEAEKSRQGNDLSGLIDRICAPDQPELF